MWVAIASRTRCDKPHLLSLKLNPGCILKGWLSLSDEQLLLVDKDHFIFFLGSCWVFNCCFSSVFTFQLLSSNLGVSLTLSLLILLIAYSDSCWLRSVAGGFQRDMLLLSGASAKCVVWLEPWLLSTNICPHSHVPFSQWMFQSLFAI